MSKKSRNGLLNQSEVDLSKAMKDMVLIEVTMVVAIELHESVEQNRASVCAMDHIETSGFANIVSFVEEELELVSAKTKEKKQ